MALKEKPGINALRNLISIKDSKSKAIYLKYCVVYRFFKTAPRDNSMIQFIDLYKVKF